MVRKIVLLSLALAGIVPLYAQSMDGGLLRDVVVTARPIRDQALTKTVIDSVQMAESANLTFSELLSKHSSIFVKTYGQGSTATVSFRGTAASHTQVQWNGVNINNPMLGQVDFWLQAQPDSQEAAEYRRWLLAEMRDKR